MNEIQDKEDRWPLLGKLFHFRIFQVLILGFSGWFIWVGATGILTGNMPWPFAVNTLSYEEYLRSQEQARSIFPWIIGSTLIFAGVLFGGRIFYLLARRVLNRQGEVDKPNGNN